VGQRDVDHGAGCRIVPGKSEGELQEATASNSGITVKLICDPATFGELEAAWDDLLEYSTANGLFLGWQWLHSWWETWAVGNNLKLFLLLAYRENELLGIAPLYLDKMSLPGGIRVRRLQFIGNAWRHRETVRTEYLEFIAHEKFQEEVCAEFVDYISSVKVWDEFVICDLLRSTETYRQILGYGQQNRWLVFDRSVDYGVCIETTGSFQDYLASLGSHTRLRLYNRRKYLNSRGDITQTRASLDELDGYFDILNSLHSKRWGRGCFSGDSLRFHKLFLSRLKDSRCFDLACIHCDGIPISAIYNIRVKNAVFNLQSGFVEDFDKKLSLGTLHLGLSIESAFNDPGVQSFDLLAGRGKKYFYKPRYHGEIIEFVTLQVVRRRSLKLIYRLYMLLPAMLRGKARVPASGEGEW
jgi:predicted N-acyltransferase